MRVARHLTPAGSGSSRPRSQTCLTRTHTALHSPPTHTAGTRRAPHRPLRDFPKVVTQSYESYCVACSRCRGADNSGRACGAAARADWRAAAAAVAAATRPTRSAVRAHAARRRLASRRHTLTQLACCGSTARHACRLRRTVLAHWPHDILFQKSFPESDIHPK